jgi:DNA-binding MarR family transcriptional regulator
LLESVVLSSGGMTARLDALAGAGYIARKQSPTDRRMVVIELTSKGRRLIDNATKTRFNEAKDALPGLSEAELAVLTGLLRRWLASVAG